MGPVQTPDTAADIHRAQQLSAIAEALPRRAGDLHRLFLTRTSVAISRTEIGVLRSLTERPRRITELACEERVTQPAITLLVNRLAERGLVERLPDPSDRRAVLVRLTDAGHATFERLRADYREMLYAEMEGLEDREVEVLARAVEILNDLVERLRRVPARAPAEHPNSSLTPRRNPEVL